MLNRPPAHDRRDGRARALHAFRDIARATDRRTAIFAHLPRTAVGNSAPLAHFDERATVAATLVFANANSLPFDWAARLAVGGSHLNFFLVRQFPVLPPEAYLERSDGGDSKRYVEFVTPRALELSYTADDVAPFARDLGYDGPPFRWDDDRRHRLQSELDAIFARMYGLGRSELEWILDAPPPADLFRSLKAAEVQEFGEYRTRRRILRAFDQLAQGHEPTLDP